MKQRILSIVLVLLLGTFTAFATETDFQYLRLVDNFKSAYTSGHFIALLGESQIVYKHDTKSPWQRVVVRDQPLNDEYKACTYNSETEDFYVFSSEGALLKLSKTQGYAPEVIHSFKITCLEAIGVDANRFLVADSKSNIILINTKTLLSDTLIRLRLLANFSKVNGYIYAVSDLGEEIVLDENCNIISQKLYNLPRQIKIGVIYDGKRTIYVDEGGNADHDYYYLDSANSRLVKFYSETNGVVHLGETELTISNIDGAKTTFDSNYNILKKEYSKENYSSLNVLLQRTVVSNSGVYSFGAAHTIASYELDKKVVSIESHSVYGSYDYQEPMLGSAQNMFRLIPSVGIVSSSNNGVTWVCEKSNSQSSIWWLGFSGAFYNKSRGLVAAGVASNKLMRFNEETHLSYLENLPDSSVASAMFVNAEGHITTYDNNTGKVWQQKTESENWNTIATIQPIDGLARVVMLENNILAYHTGYIPNDMWYVVREPIESKLTWINVTTQKTSTVTFYDYAHIRNIVQLKNGEIYAIAQKNLRSEPANNIILKILLGDQISIQEVTTTHIPYTIAPYKDMLTYASVGSVYMLIPSVPSTEKKICTIPAEILSYAEIPNGIFAAGMMDTHFITINDSAFTTVQENIAQYRPNFQIALCPNPSREATRVSIYGQGEIYGNYKVTLASYLGAVLAEYNIGFPNPGVTEISIPTFMLANGMYVVSVQNGGQIQRSMLCVAN